MMFKSLRWMTALAVICLLAAGCSDDPTTAGAGDGTELNLEDDLGGYTATNEPELSDDSVVGGFASAEGVVNDPLADDPEFAGALDGTAFFNVYFVRLAWGVLPQDDVTDTAQPDGAEVDWSGAIESSAGGVIALRTILFERNDQLIFPRDNRTRLAFESTTFGHWDGVLVAVAIPENEDDGTATLSFATGPFEHTWTFADLENMNQVYDTNVADHQVSIIALKRQSGDCSQGFVMGRWVDTTDNGGTFRGVWVSLDGNAVGLLKGHYGVRERDAMSVLFGKYFDSAGNFLGFIRGHYAVSLREYVGSFRAVLLDENGENEEGFIKGHWLQVPQTNHGYFSGRWADCPDVTEGDGTSDDGGIL